MSNYILNKIDVNKCKNYRKECVYNSCDLGDDTICNGLCHFGAMELFKQLQQSEARVKELEEKLNAQFAEMEEKLTAEEMKNFELKQEIKELKDYIRWIMSL